MSKAYHITHWDTHYETSNSRKIQNLTYYQKSNKLVGEGIGATLQHEHNLALLGTWTLIEALASTSVQKQRGWLIRNGTALTAARMAALTRVDTVHFERALAWFSRPEIGWLELKETAAVLGESPTNPPQEQDGGRLAGESPTNPPQERERERDFRETRERRERGAHSFRCAGFGTFP